MRYWLPVLVWMSLIFTASGDTQSGQRSSRLIGPLVRWLLPRLDDASVGQVVLLVRKGAHVAEYAVLALLVWRALRSPTRDQPQPWRWSQAAFALAVTTLYAGSDELHQLLVPKREGRWEDVAIDAAGAALGLSALWLFGKWRKLW